MINVDFSFNFLDVHTIFIAYTGQCCLAQICLLYVYYIYSVRVEIQSLRILPSASQFIN